MHNERDWSDYTCPHCGAEIWDGDYSNTDNYVEDEYYIEEVTCECGCECRFYRRIDDYPNYVAWDTPENDSRDNLSEILRQTSQEIDAEIENILASPAPVWYMGPNSQRVNPNIMTEDRKDEKERVHKSMVAAWNALHSNVTAPPPRYILQNGAIMHDGLEDIHRRIVELASHSPA